MRRKRSNVVILVCVLLVLVIGGFVGYFTYLRPHHIAVGNFNAAVDYVEGKNAELDAAVNETQAVLDSGENVFDESTITHAKEVIQFASEMRVQIPERPSKINDINLAAQALNQPIDYSSNIGELKSAKKSVEDSILQRKQLTNPSGEFVLDRLQKVSSIVGVQAVTEDNDPNGNLNKPGGYTAAVYFESPLVSQQMVSGSSIVEKGTDGGGCIEVYATEEDAEKRNTYLSSFDGATFLNSGSHRVAGTVVIRISSKLSATKQKELEQQVLDSLLAFQN